MKNKIEKPAISDDYVGIGCWLGILVVLSLISWCIMSMWLWVQYVQHIPGA